MENRKSAVKASSSVTSVSSGVVDATTSKSKSKSSTQQQQKKQAAVPPLPSDSKSGNDSPSAPPPIEDTEESLSTQIREIESLIKEAEKAESKEANAALASLCVHRAQLLVRKVKITWDVSDQKDLVDAIKAVEGDDDIINEDKEGICSSAKGIGMCLYLYLCLCLMNSVYLLIS